MHNALRYTSIFMIAFGGICFVSGSVLPSFDKSLRLVEFPVILGARTIKAPDGQLYSAIGSLNRIQRYNKDGKFQLGWFVDGAGGKIAIGLTEKGEIISISARRNLVEIFNSEGVRLKSLVNFRKPIGFKFPETIIRIQDYKSSEFSLLNPVIVDNPKLPKLPNLVLLFAYSFFAWFLLATGCIGYGFERKMRNADSSA